MGKGSCTPGLSRGANTPTTRHLPVPPQFILRMILSHKHHDSFVLLQLKKYHLCKLNVYFIVVVVITIIICVCFFIILCVCVYVCVHACMMYVCEYMSRDTHVEVGGQLCELVLVCLCGMQGYNNSGGQLLSRKLLSLPVEPFH